MDMRSMAIFIIITIIASSINGHEQTSSSPPPSSSSSSSSPKKASDTAKIIADKDQIKSSTQSTVSTTTIERLPEPIAFKKVNDDSAINGDQEQSADELSCESICEKTYPLHTYPKSDDWFACHRGCRFFKLVQVLSTGQSDKSNRNSCYSACADAYNETALDYACTLGCNSQTSSARKDLHHHQKKHETSPWSWTPNIYFTLRSSYSRPGISNDKESMDTSPLDMMKQLFSSLSQRVHSTSMWVTRKTSFTFLIGQGSDGKEKLLLLQPKQDTLQTQTSPAEPESVVNSYPDILPSYNFADGSRVISADKPATKIDLKPIWPDWFTWAHSIEKFNAENKIKESPAKSTNWFTCFTYRNGNIPRWLLAFLLLLAILVLAWICCATTATAPDQHVRRQVGIGSDLPFLMLHNEPTSKLLLFDDDNGNEEKKMHILNGEMPPSYEEAQLQPKFEVKIATDASDADEKKCNTEASF